MRVFLSGGSGFIGRHLLPLLGNHEVLCISRSTTAADASPAVRTIRGDLSAPDSYSREIERFKPECCIHLAWEALPDYSFSACRANMLASLDLFEILGRVGCRTIFAPGTCWEYGNLAGSAGEGQQGRELNVFAAFKTAIQTVGQSLCARYGCELKWGRLFFVYGPGQRMTSLIPSCYRSFSLDGTAPRISNPLAVNDFIHVADVGAAIRKLIERGSAEGIYNIGSGRPVAVWQVVNLVAELMGAMPVYRDMAQPSAGFWADTAKMHALGWQAEISLRAGIAQTLESLGGCR